MAINRTLSGCAGAALALSLGLGLGFGSGSAALAAKDELVIGAVQFPGTFHPSIDAMATKSYILGAARRPFTTFDQDWKLICLLCTELPSLEKGTAVEVTRPDGTRAIDATFTIQPGATWGDGKPLTTRDVLFTWEVGRHPLSGVTNAQLFSKDIVGITAVDDKTFTVHWDKYRCSYDSINDLLVLPEHLERPVFEADPAQYRNRTLYDTDRTNPGLYFGPYRISRVESGAYVVLEPNPTWWGEKPGFGRIVVRTIENTSAMEANLLSGEVDYVAGEVGLSIEQALAFEKRHGQRFKVVYQPGLFFEHIDLNLDNPILADVRVRRALLTAIDRDAISRQLFGGKQPVAHTGVNPLDRYYSEDFTRYPFDPAAAVKLLEEAGWTELRGGVRHDAAGRRLSLEFQSTAGNRTRELVQQVLQEQWRKVGVEVRINNQPARVLFGETLRERRFPAMAMFAWLSAPENIPRTILHSTMIPTPENGFSGQNYVGFRDAETDRIIDDLEVTCGEAEARPLWTRLQQIYAEQLPALPLYFRSDSYIMPPWLEGVRPTGHQYPSTLWIEQWRSK
ncbi:peptide ABC transporter substrate-binding protein [Skermanella mucosa]|uniref:peptide ABC transporter substrate-binding protein n=1 Tax=Skermanella mucosa TaxID=1789672 RepID=UPI001E4F755B|nr:peptide ABC transporter substrate-binding protein [Skermanella mucosa]UEM18638.1 peptide ABC transporter substrate-binding protein [Skermanella mucosa]